MSATTSKPMSRLRASSVRDCARKAILEATGEPERDWTRAEKGTLWRGRRIGQDFCIFFAAEHGLSIWAASGDHDWIPKDMRASSIDTAGVLAEKPVRWEFGVGHQDFFVVSTGTVVEVLSSATASAAMVDSKVLQNVLYQEHDPDANNGAVIVIDPSTMLDTDRVVITPGTKTYTSLVAEMTARIDSVRAYRDTGTLPDRVCGKPSDARGHWCRHPKRCFEGWEAPAPAAVFDDDEAREYAAAYYRAKQDETAAKQTYDSLVTYRKEVEEHVAAMFDTAGLAGQKVKARSGPLELAQIVVGDHQELSLKKARLAGVWTDAHDELFQDFLAMRGGHTRYQVDRVSDEPVEDFGAEAPWTADVLGDAAA
jgi:hypothetical protein